LPDRRLPWAFAEDFVIAQPRFGGVAIQLDCFLAAQSRLVAMTV
jgi:hypothetical protein